MIVFTLYFVKTVSDKLQNKFIILYLSAIELTCQTTSEKRQTVSDKLQNKFIILYLSAIELTCQTMSEKRQTVE